MIPFTFEQFIQQFMLLMRSFTCFMTIEDLHVTFVKYYSRNDGVDRMILRNQVIFVVWHPFFENTRVLKCQGCNKVAGNNWTQNWRKYDTIDLVTKLILINKRLLLHTCYLTGEWHARKISNYFLMLISVHQG